LTLLFILKVDVICIAVTTMGDTLTNSRVFYGDLLDHYQALLDTSYHRLTRIIRPHLFYGWLRAKRVFTQTDQEEVENKYVTMCMKAG